MVRARKSVLYRHRLRSSLGHITFALRIPLLNPQQDDYPITGSTPENVLFIVG